MLRNCSGFTYIEMLISFTIIVTIVTVTIPLMTILNKERLILSERREIAYKLHDKLIESIWKNEYKNEVMTINNKKVKLTFHPEDELIKGCANWDNVKKQKETICLYGYPEK